MFSVTKEAIFDKEVFWQDKNVAFFESIVNLLSNKSRLS